MKLRNKKTGEVVSKIDVSQDGSGIWVLGSKPEYYSSLAEFNNEWEDYKPAEPLIKDEKIRKALRAWAEACGVGRVVYREDNYRFLALDTEVGSMIEFENMPEYIGLKHENEYYIAELCGEKEE